MDRDREACLLTTELAESWPCGWGQTWCSHWARFAMSPFGCMLVGGTVLRLKGVRAWASESKKKL